MKVTEMSAVAGRLKSLRCGRRHEGHTRVMALFLSLLLLMSIGEGTLAMRTRHAGATIRRNNQDAAQKAEAAVMRLFGAGVEVAKDRKPYFLTGDFNGDSREDLLALIQLKQAKSSLPKQVVVLNPWGHESKDSQGTSNLALVVVHGAAAGWDTETPAGRYLLTDRDYFSTPTWDAPTPEGVSLLSLRKKRPARGSKVEAAPRMARGDAVALPTEAGIDIFLYWDGKTYKVYEPAEEP